VIADVKFFKNHKGYGFIVADEVDEDIFIHFRVLEKNGFSTLEQGQRLLVGLEDGERGKQVTTFRIYTGDDDMIEDVVEEPPKKKAKKSSAKTRKDDKPSDEA